MKKHLNLANISYNIHIVISRYVFCCSWNGLCYTQNNMDKDNSRYIGIGIALGTALGVAFGTVFENVSIGIGLGISIGLIVGVVAGSVSGGSGKK